MNVAKTSEQVNNFMLTVYEIDMMITFVTRSTDIVIIHDVSYSLLK